ncbi:MAG TPA: hypothetical protein VLC46_03470 [Thermoanaerobaculia bacterium]|jgi:hypothetical protein|nr:hypothetical protein [Thermoanaerobaculia bacterium]
MDSEAVAVDFDRGLDFFPDTTTWTVEEENDMALRQLIRLTLRLANGDDRHVFVKVATLTKEQRKFLDDSGVKVEDGVFDYTFPAFYDNTDVKHLQEQLHDSWVEATHTPSVRGVKIPGL